MKSKFRFPKQANNGKDLLLCDSSLVFYDFLYTLSFSFNQYLQSQFKNIIAGYCESKIFRSVQNECSSVSTIFSMWYSFQTYFYHSHCHKINYKHNHNRSSNRRCSVRKAVLRNFAKFTGKHLCQSLSIHKIAEVRPATLLKKRFWHRCFPVNFAKCLRTPFLQNTFRRPLPS